MMEFEIIITPAGGHRQAEMFAAHWGDILLATSRTPFFDSARKLLELGAEPNDLLIMRHRSSSTTSLRARLSVARSTEQMLARIWVRSRMVKNFELRLLFGNVYANICLLWPLSSS